MANAHNAVDSAVGIEQMIRFMSGWNSFQRLCALWTFDRLPGASKTLTITSRGGKRELPRTRGKMVI
jgi:hypothetical protein